MFVGHFAPALVAATRPHAAGLGTLFVAAQIVDIGFAALLIPGIEAMRIAPGITAMNPMDLYHMPYTHSLLGAALWAALFARSEEHTSELQSLMRISYAVFCLQKKTTPQQNH